LFPVPRCKTASGGLKMQGFAHSHKQHQTTDASGIWRYEAADWVVEPGLIDHHLRIVRGFVNHEGVRTYQVFDTSLRVGFSDYSLRLADELESKSRLQSRPPVLQVPFILHRTELCRYIDYSLLARTDCESLQRWIHTGNEQNRWSPQVWTFVATVFGSIVVALVQHQPPQRIHRRRRYR
jgi:hypothetical protein